MATIGQALTAPETGWKRYDDTDSRISYNGTWVTSSGNSSYYNNLMHYSSVPGSKVLFKFYGTKLRIISQLFSVSDTDTIIMIDGIQYTYTEYSSSSNIYQALVFEITNLSLGNHIVSIITSDDCSTSKYCRLDAIDIDSNGFLIHPILNEVHNINDIKNIGDCIPCRYTTLISGQVGTFSELGTTIASLIPPTSSAIPDGSFYWVYVGKDYLGRKKFIADRNIQHSISWDTLNSAGICSELPLAYINDVDAIPKMTNNIAPSGVALASSTMTGYDAYKAFDKVDGSDSSCWISNNIATGWLEYDFDLPKIIKKYTLTHYYSTITWSPKSWTFEGWNGSSWVVLDTQTNITNWYNGSIKEFNIANNISYTKYRLNINANNGHTYIAIYKLEMFESQSKQNNFSIRLLTGGTSALDLDNEWDKIIASSTLGGTITAGDNNVWNWSNPSPASLVSTRTGPTTTNVRGYALVNTSYPTTATNLVDASNGFRPVLLVETLVVDKFLIKKDSNYYSIDPKYYDVALHSFLPLTLTGGSMPNKIDIDTFGFDDINKILSSMTSGSDTFKPIDKFDKFEIKLYKIT